MADGPAAYAKPDQITAAANKVLDAAVKARGEVELRYVPKGPSRDHWAAGQDSMDRGVVAGDYGGYATDSKGIYLGTDADWAALRSQYTWIPDLFTFRIDPDPILFQPLIDGMEQTALTIHDDPNKMTSSPVAQYIEDVRGAVSGWKGTAAETFRANFVNRLEIAAQNQAYIAGAMMHAMIAERDTFVAVRNDLLGTANDAVNAIEGITDKDPGTTKTILTVAAAVTGLLAGVASIPISGGLLVPAEIQAGLWIISGASATMGLPTYKDNTGSQLAAHTVDGVLSNMIDALTRIDNYVTSHETDVIKSLNSCHDKLTDKHERAILLVPPPPGLAGDTGAQIKSDFMPP